MEKMERLTEIAQSYSQAPWRKQWQFIGLFSLALVLIAMVASIYLNISAQAAAVGRDIQTMQRRIDELDEEIEDLESDVASLLSADEMFDRAEEMGFAPMDSEQLVFISIPGYVERQPVVMAPYNNQSVSRATQLPSEYTESLFDWLRRKTLNLSLPDFEVKQ
jgi:cell division protein FtsL